MRKSARLAISSAPPLTLLVLASLLFVDTAGGQFYHFGKNKVQYAHFEWLEMQTEHFDIYFYESEVELAGYAAQMAESGYVELERKLGHTVQRRIPLILYSSHIYFEQTNIIPNLLPEGVAGFTEFLKGRVVLPLSGSFPEFERVLHHELVHVFTFDKIQQVSRRHGISDFWPAPLWFSEGLAEYWSDSWNSYGEMIVRDALFSRRLAPLQRIHILHGTFQLYKQGESICAYMAEAYGEDIFNRLLENWWRNESFAEVFELTTGDPLSKLDEDWRYRTEKEYLPDIASSDPPSQTGTPITRSGFNVKPQIVGRDEENLRLVFFRNHQGATEIASVSTDGSELHVVVEGERSAEFEALHPLVTKPAVSADGNLLAFSAKSGGRDRLYIWDLVNRRQIKSLEFDGVISITSPTWSPTADRIVFSGAREGGKADLFIVHVETGECSDLTDDIFHDRDPDWSPDGRWIAFSSDRWPGGRDGLYNLFAYDFEAGEVRNLTNGSQNDLFPDWSADGARLVFSSDRDGAFNLYSLDLGASRSKDGFVTQRLTRTLTGLFDPVWSPDGNSVFFSGFESGRFHIYRQQVAANDSTRSAAQPSLDPEPWRLESLSAGGLLAREYKRSLSLDIAQSQIAQDPEFGTSGGIQLGMSDVLGNDRFFLIVSHISGNSDLFSGMNLALGRQHLGRQVNVTWSLFRLNDRFSSNFGRFVREKRVGGNLEISYPFTKFDRLDTRLSLRHADIDRDFEGRPLKGWLATNFISFTHDSSFWIPTGPLAGTRYSAGLAQTVDFKSSRRFNVTLFGDLRHYLRLSRTSALALRLMARRSGGDVPELFSMGGSWTLRGYGWRSLWGSKLLLSNAELRFPLLHRLRLDLPIGGMELSALRGALFVDAGNAWSRGFDEIKGSIGAGTRVALGGVFVLRLDASRRTDFKSIENDTQWDFFFGWDY